MAEYEIRCEHKRKCLSKAVGDAMVSLWNTRFEEDEVLPCCLGYGIGSYCAPTEGSGWIAKMAVELSADSYSEAVVIRRSLLKFLKDLDIQSDRVYLEIERMMDTRIDCCTVAA